MALVELEESELLALRGTQQAVAAIMAHPEARTMILEARKKANPNVSIPEIDAAQPIKNELAKLREEQSAWINEQKAAQAKREEEEKISRFTSSWESAKGRVRQEYPHFNDEAIKAIEELCTSRGIADFEVGAAYFAKQNPPPSLEAPSGANNAFGFFETPASNEGLKKFIDAEMAAQGEDDRALDSFVRDVLAESRGRKAA